MGKIELYTKITDILKKIVPPINDIVNDDQFRDGLTKAGGLISLVAVGLDAYDRLHNSLETDEARGLNSLNKCLLATTEEVLREISAKYLKNEEINIDKDFDKKRETIDDLFKSFKEDSYDDGIFYFFPYRFPPVRMFKSIIKSKLEKYQNNKEIIEFFDKNFEAKLKVKIIKNDNIKTFLTRIKTEQQERQNIDYLQRFLEYTIERSSLDNYYYVKNRQAVLAGKHTWNWTNKKIEGNKKQYVIKKDAEEIINDFIENEPQTKHYMFIAATFGTGKSFLIKKISSDYATKFLQKKSEYIPIVVYLGEAGLKSVNEDDNLDRVLKNIATVDSVEVFDPKILLIIDGLDEYKGKLSDLMNEIRSKMEKYTFYKIILTTRPLSNLPEELEIEKYMRLLPFTKEQVNEFFGQTNAKLTYEGAKKSGLNEEEITKPLLAWMLSQIPAITEDPEDLGRLKLSEEKLTGNETKSLIYLHFFHHIIAGKPVDPTKGEDESLIRRRYIEEKKALRKIAIVKQNQNENKITLEDYKKAFPDDTKDSPVLNQIFKSYFYIGDESDGDKKTTISFEHTTYRDYLISEYYLEYFLKKDKEDTEDAMITGVPSSITMEFLEGLVRLLTSEDHNIKKLLEYDIDNISLLNSFEYREGLDNAKEQIKNTALNLINKQINSSINYNKIRESEEKKSDGVDLSIDKWISLYILNILIPGEFSTEENKKILSKLIRETSQQIPLYVKKLKQLDLSGEDLAGADLVHADLSNTNLSHAYLGRVDLSNANLSNANLSNANLTDANLKDTDLSTANLSHANLNEADLIGADLTDANLTDADLSDAKMQGSILIKAKLKDADLSCTNLSEADLSYATLEEANFWRANLSKAKLISSKLLNTQLPRADLTDANLTFADLSGANLMKTDMKKAKLNNAKFANASLFDADLRDANLSNVDLSNAHLSYVKAEKIFLCNSNLSNAYLLKSNFSDSNLSNACIDNTSLSHVNFNGCNLTSSKMTNITKYDDLKCRDADFNGSSIDSQDIIVYLHKNNARNVPSQTSTTSNNYIEN